MDQYRAVEELEELERSAGTHPGAFLTTLPDRPEAFRLIHMPAPFGLLFSTPLLFFINLKFFIQANLGRIAAVSHDHQ